MKRKLKLYRFLIFLLLISFSVIAGDCEKTLSGGGGEVPADLVGNWKLIEQTGALQDICNNETINFQSSGVAQLTCPNSTAISRNYSVQNNVLTYTETSVSYDIQFSNNNSNLILNGRNISRNLKYEKIVTDNVPVHSGKNNSVNNSSEGGK